MRTISIFLALTAIVATTSAFAWREVGHFGICEIAYRNLTPVAKAKVDKILGGKSFAEQCTWPDMVRKSSEWKHTYDWHFVNVEDDQDYLSPGIVNPEGDVMSAILTSATRLRNPGLTAPQKKSALLFLSHFVGDIHQVVHIGRKTDLGGNKLIVSWFDNIQFDDVEHLRAHDDHAEECLGPFYQDEPTGECVSVDSRRSQINLHKLWDLLMVDTFISEKGIRSSAQYPYKEYIAVIDRVSATQVAHWKNSSVLEWAQESLCYRPHLYKIGNRKLNRDYYDSHIKTLNERILMAGYRLGHMMNRIFDPAIEAKSSGISAKDKELSKALEDAKKGKKTNLRLSLKQCSLLDT